MRECPGQTAHHHGGEEQVDSEGQVLGPVLGRLALLLAPDLGMIDTNSERCKMKWGHIQIGAMKWGLLGERRGVEGVRWAGCEEAEARRRRRVHTHPDGHLLLLLLLGGRGRARAAGAGLTLLLRADQRQRPRGRRLLPEPRDRRPAGGRGAGGGGEGSKSVVGGGSGGITLSTPHQSL
jgi:hypothetical protein